MNEQNPYAVREVEQQRPFPDGPGGREFDLPVVARYHVWTVRSLVAHILAFAIALLVAGVSGSPSIYSIMTAAAFIAYFVAVGSAMLLATSITETNRTIVFLVLPAMVPVVGWFIIGGIRSYAGAILKRAGYRITWSARARPPTTSER